MKEMKKIITREDLKFFKKRCGEELKENKELTSVFLKSLEGGNRTEKEKEEFVCFLNDLKKIREWLEDNIEGIEDLLKLGVVDIQIIDKER